MRLLLLLVVVAAAAVIPFLLGPGDWVVERPVSVVRTGSLPADAAETSGVVASAAHPKRFWTILDSGNPAAILAIDSAGTVHAAVRLDGAENRDWEAVSVGPCPAGTCVYAGDIGDNRARRSGVTIYRAAEPEPAAKDSVVPAEALHLRYPDGPHDAEAMLVTPSGDLLIITKGLASAVTAYRVPAGEWASADTVAAEPLGPLPIEPRSAIGRWVTDAALASDGRRVVIRTYRDIFFFLLGADGTLTPGEPPTLCDISGLEGQGEGIGWADDSTLVLTSETAQGAPGVVHLVRCPASFPPA